MSILYNSMFILFNSENKQKTVEKYWVIAEKSY